MRATGVKEGAVSSSGLLERLGLGIGRQWQPCYTGRGCSRAVVICRYLWWRGLIERWLCTCPGSEAAAAPSSLSALWLLRVFSVSPCIWQRAIKLRRACVSTEGGHSVLYLPLELQFVEVNGCRCRRWLEYSTVDGRVHAWEPVDAHGRVRSQFNGVHMSTSQIILSFAWIQAQSLAAAPWLSTTSIISQHWRYFRNASMAFRTQLAKLARALELQATAEACVARATFRAAAWAGNLRTRARCKTRGPAFLVQTCSNPAPRARQRPQTCYRRALCISTTWITSPR